jgi:hypothetical protein
MIRSPIGEVDAISHAEQPHEVSAGDSLFFSSRWHDSSRGIFIVASAAAILAAVRDVVFLVVTAEEEVRRAP